MKGKSSSKWIKYHDPLDIGRNNTFYNQFVNINVNQIGEKFGNYIGALSWLANCGHGMDRTVGIVV